jgi:hypothetical protein
MMLTTLIFWRLSAYLWYVYPARYSTKRGGFDNEGSVLPRLGET